MTDNLNSSPETKQDFAAKKQRIIMLVEDFEVDKEVYRRYLQTESTYQYTFIEAETGEEAFESYQQYLPDLVLLDYLLPDINGIEWLAQLQKYYKNPCPVIVLTGQGDENIAVQFIKIGAVDYFVKGQITAEKLKLSVSREISLQDLKQEQQDFVQTIKSQAETLNKTNELLKIKVNQCEVSRKLIYDSEEKLRLALTYAPIPIMIHSDDGEIIQISDTWTELSGYTIEDIPTIDDWIKKAYPKRQEFIRQAVARLYELDRRVEEGEFKILTKDQATRIWDFSSAPLGKLSDGRRLVISIAKDVTESRQAEIALELSEKKFRNTFEQAAVGIAHVAPDGTWLKVNQKLCQIVGYSKDELLSATFQTITHPDDLHKDLQYVQQALAGEISTYFMEKRYIRKSGELVWINLTVSLVRDLAEEPDYFISVIEDISDRKNLELSLQKSLKRLSNLHQIDKAILAAEKPQAIARTVIEDIQNFITCQRTSIITFDWKKETATVLATNGVGSNILGNKWQTSLVIWQEVIEQLQAVNENQNYFIAYLNQLPSLSQMALALSSTELDCFVAFPLKSRDNLLGILKLWVVNPQAITVEELTMVEEISSQLAIALEQTRLHKQTQNYALQLEARVAQRTAQLEEINQELKAFTYTISHDLKAPLRAIQGFAAALQEDYADFLDDLGQEYTSRLISSAQQMTQLIEDLLTYSRLSRREIKLQSVKLSAVIDQAIEQLKPEIERTQAQITLVEPLATITGNQTVLIQIVSNLLSNAIKFVPSTVQPQIQIRTETTQSLTSAANNIRLSLTDNGIGIKPEHQERIFRVFERLHGNEVYPGTGIGLAIVKKGMERLGGRLGVESQLGKGSCFWIEGQKINKS